MKATRRSVSLAASRFNADRSEEHTSNSSHSQISYAVFFFKKKKLPWDGCGTRTRAWLRRRGLEAFRRLPALPLAPGRWRWGNPLAAPLRLALSLFRRTRTYA